MIRLQNSGLHGPKVGNGLLNTASPDLDAAALGVLVRLSRPKRLLIRAFETIMYLVVRAVDPSDATQVQPVEEVRKILVVEYWNLGDIIMLLPFLKSLRLQYPNSQITLLTSPKVIPLLEDQEIVDELIPVLVPWAQHHSGWRKYNPFTTLWVKLARTLILLRGAQFDLAVTGRADIRDNFFLWLTAARRRVGYAFGGGGFFLTDVATPDLDHPHYSYRWLRLLEHLGKLVLNQNTRLRLAPDQVAFAEQFLAHRGVLNGEFILGVHPGARALTRQWGNENFRVVAEQLAKQFSLKILWFQDPKESKQGQGTTHGFIPVTLPLRPFMSVLARCGLLICNDSGPMHIATALGVPVVAVFGPGEPSRFGPWGRENRVVIRNGFWCRPCFDYCIFDQPYCLRTVSVENVLGVAAQVLNALMPKACQGEVKDKVAR